LGGFMRFWSTVRRVGTEDRGNKNEYLKRVLNRRRNTGKEKKFRMSSSGTKAGKKKKGPQRG